MNAYHRSAALSSACVAALLFTYGLTNAQILVVDHGGADWGPENGSLVNGGTYWGEHINVGIFYVPAGWSLNIATYDGSGGGFLIVRAKQVLVDGLLDGRRSGYAGGGGGGGGGGADGDHPGAGGAGGGRG